MTVIYIENKPYEVKDGQNLLNACLTLGFDIPYFCWHPALNSVGACRLCAVKQFKDEKDEKGKIVMSCMTPASDGARISIVDPEVKAFRAGVIEWLMMNHPHDCPVCDEGGECHLQDMTVMTGHVYRRYGFRKRTYRNQNLGPFVNHEMNRCIQCYRCVRFYRDYAGGRDFNVFASRDHVYFGRHEDGALENGFSGNLIEVCPTGVFTDKTLKKHYTRKWDLQTAPSVCVHCGLGCNTIPGERYGKLRRILNRYNSEVNGYFLCDRGRFGYEFVNSEKRIVHPVLKGSPSDKKEVLHYLSGLLHFGAKVMGIGSPRASIEANFALRSLVGAENFYPGLSENESLLLSEILSVLRKGPVRSASLNDARKADTALVLGEDLTNYSPLLDLSLRQSVLNKPKEIAKRLQIPGWHDAAFREAVQDKKGPLFIASPYSTGFEDIATLKYHGAPEDIARLGFAVAHAISKSAPAVSDLSDELSFIVNNIARELKDAKKPLIVSGTSCGSREIVQAAANIAWALSEIGVGSELCFTVPECNSLGLSLMDDKSIDDALRALEGGDIETVIILENDLYRRVDEKTVNKLFEKVKHIVVIDHMPNRTAWRAEVVLPAATFAESTGTLVNCEGRAQRFFRVFVPQEEIQESWRWLSDMTSASGRSESVEVHTINHIIAQIAGSLPAFKNLAEVAPRADFRIKGLKIPRQPHRYSGRTAMLANISVHEPKPPGDPDSALAFSMEGYEGRPPSSLISRYWSPGWNSVQALNKFQREIGSELHGGDPGLRLTEPGLGSGMTFFSNIPEPFKLRENEWLILPLYHIFGSEELSIWSHAISEITPKPYIAINKDDAARLGVDEGDEVEFLIDERKYRFPSRIISKLPAGTAGLPAGLPGLEGIFLPAWGKVFSLGKEE